MNKLTVELINKNLKFRGEKVTMPVSLWAKIAKTISIVLPERKEVEHIHWADIHGDHFCEYCNEFFDLPVKPLLESTELTSYLEMAKKDLK